MILGYEEIVFPYYVGAVPELPIVDFRSGDGKPSPYKL